MATGRSAHRRWRGRDSNLRTEAGTVAEQALVSHLFAGPRLSSQSLVRAGGRDVAITEREGRLLRNAVAHHAARPRFRLMHMSCGTMNGALMPDLPRRALPRLLPNTC